MIRRVLAALAPVLALGACTASDSVVFNVVTAPPWAQVDVAGISYGAAPVQISFACERHWVGYGFSPDGWARSGAPVEITAYPSTQNPGYSQTKRIDPCAWRGGGPAQVRFDLGLDSVRPRERIEVR